MILLRAGSASAIAAFLLFSALPSASQAKDFGAVSPKVKCEAMAGFKIPASKIAFKTKGASISTAIVKSPQGEGAPDYTPEVCELTGAIVSVDPAAPPINFRVAIPTAWNQKAIQIGGNGRNGFIPLLTKFNRGGGGSPFGPAFPPDAPLPVAHGYATYGGDSGHGGAFAPGTAPAAAPGVGGAPPPAATDWTKNEESVLNFANQSVKKTHDVSIAVIKQMYGRAPRINMFMGESQGGRDAFIAATRYPRDYNGVLISVPLTYYTSLMWRQIWRQQAQIAPGAWIPPTKAKTIQNAILAQCDALDGLADGVINNYYACNSKLDPTITAANGFESILCKGADSDDCLTAKQIETLRGFYAPKKWGFAMPNDGETMWPGEGTGNEQAPGWLLLAKQPSLDDPAIDERLSIQLGAPPTLTSMKADIYSYQAPLKRYAAQHDISNDWSNLLAAKTKVIFYSSASDYLVNARGHQMLYERAVARHGQSAVDKTIRFYVSPNTAHGSNGFSATTGAQVPQHSDMVAYLERWVEDGQAPPDAPVQSLKEKSAPYKVVRSRPICRFPMYPRYTGGDADQAGSYTCTKP